MKTLHVYNVLLLNFRAEIQAISLTSLFNGKIPIGFV